MAGRSTADPRLDSKPNQLSLTAPAHDRTQALVIVTVAYHSQAPLEGLAADLIRQTQPPIQWLVVDHAPLSAPLRRQGSLAAPESDRLPLRIVSGEEGAGFGEGCNRALDLLERQGWTGWVWLLNPDASLPEPDLIERFSGLLANLPDRGLVGTAVWSPEGELEPSGGWITPGLAFRRRRIEPTHLEAARSTTLSLDWLSGCSLALRPTAHHPPARFDPGLPLYYEDMDLCLRLGAGNASCLWTSAVAIAHQRGGGSGGNLSRRVELNTFSYWRFLQRHTPGWVRSVRGLRLLATALARLPFKPHQSIAVLRGWLRALRQPLR
jgi:N-acetylglucosaminyl-diphospho-decaprenol L-rhamnosyltransferase